MNYQFENFKQSYSQQYKSITCKREQKSWNNTTMRFNILSIGLHFTSPLDPFPGFEFPFGFGSPGPISLARALLLARFLSAIRSFGRSHKDFDHYRRFLRNLARQRLSRGLALIKTAFAILWAAIKKKAHVHALCLTFVCEYGFENNRFWVEYIECFEVGFVNLIVL